MYFSHIPNTYRTHGTDHLFKVSRHEFSKSKTNVLKLNIKMNNNDAVVCSLPVILALAASYCIFGHNIVQTLSLYLDRTKIEDKKG